MSEICGKPRTWEAGGEGCTRPRGHDGPCRATTWSNGQPTNVVSSLGCGGGGYSYSTRGEGVGGTTHLVAPGGVAGAVGGSAYAPGSYGGSAGPGQRASTTPGILAPGLYRLHWRSGGSSLAAVGITVDGRNWFAPTNWVSPTDDLKHLEGLQWAEPLT